jgi:hypothetical protein
VSTFFPRQGIPVIFAEESGTPGLTLVPSAGDTINGSTDPFPVPPGGAVMLIEDGISAYRVIGVYDPALVASNSLVYRPGSGLAGPVVFDDWGALMLQLSFMRASSNGGGTYKIGIDNSIVSPAIIPVAGSPHDLTLCEINPAASTVICHIADGATFTGLRAIKGRRLFITVLSTGASPSPVADMVSGDSFILADGANVAVTPGGNPFIDLTSLLAGFVTLRTQDIGSSFGGGGVPAIHIGTAGVTVVLNADYLSGIVSGGISGIAGTTFFRSGCSDAFVDGPYAAFLGTIAGEAVAAAGPMGNLLPVAALAPATAPLAANFTSSVIRLDASGGPIAQALPLQPVSGGQAAGGARRIIVTEESGSVGLTVIPAGANTIDGAVTPVTVPAGGAITLVGDGLNNWFISAVYDPSLAPPSELVYQPGGTEAGPVIFSDWDTLNIQLALIKSVWGNAQIDLVFDASITSPIPIPVGGPYDMANVTWVGAGNAPVTVNIPEGVTFTDLRNFDGRDCRLTVTNQATATVPDTSLANQDNINVKGDARLENTGSVAMWQGTGLAGGNLIFVNVTQAGQLGFAGVPTAPFVDIFTTATLIILIRDAGFTRENSFAGPVGSTLNVAPQGDSARGRASNVGFLGTIIQTPQGIGKWLVDTALVTATPNALVSGRLARYDTTTGVIVSNLPSAATTFRGESARVKNEVGGNNVDVTPAGADTIDSVAALSAVIPGEAAEFVSNGVSNWTRI